MEAKMSYCRETCAESKVQKGDIARKLSSSQKQESLTKSSACEIGHQGGPPPIAIVGMAMRLPGGIRSSEEFWELLINKKDASTRVPQSRYNIDAFYHPTKPQSVKTRSGYFLQEDYVGSADMTFFETAGYDAGKLDPQQMLLMEVVWECMENAGQRDWRGKDIGCYVGVFGEDWHDLSAKETQDIPRVHAFATGAFALSNRISYEYDLKGPRCVQPILDMARYR